MLRRWSGKIVSRLACVIVAALVSQTQLGLGQTQSMLFDFGGADVQTALPPLFWNNITTESDSDFFDPIPLVDSEGNSVEVQILVTQLFDGTADTSGTTESSLFPGSVSGDSLIRNLGGAGFVILGVEGSVDTYDLTFYASDLNANDNRETTYQVTGAASESVTLNPSGNVNETVVVRGMGLDEFGEISVTLSAGPNHSNGNQIIYLGALELESSAGWRALIDFGDPQDTTSVVVDGELTEWNNFTGTIGQTDDGIFDGIVSAEGEDSDLFIEMLARFNGVNESGTLDSGIIPASASADSLFGNVEEFGGLSDVLPSFLIGGLEAGGSYDLTFYASRLAGDNRETVYTITGEETSFVALNVAGNISEFATATSVEPNAAGEIRIDLSPGANNNNANHFIYLGALRIDTAGSGETYLFDFGGNNTTQVDVELEPESWNNVTELVGQTDDGMLTGLLNTEFVRTEIDLEMVSRFNGVNRAGLTEASDIPGSATGDSLFGNTEVFGGLEDVFPAFKLTGPDQANAYDFTFYGSRSAGDNRETRYTASGANSAFGDLDVASNPDQTVTVSGIRPDSEGEIHIQVAPGPNNNNGNHFTYLGFMRMDWQPAFRPQILIDAGGTEFPTSQDLAGNVWNNFQGSVGQTDDGVLSDLVSVNGEPTSFGIQMLARFNGVNQAGTTDPAPYATSATRDSLYGNTEEWAGLTDVFPRFQLTGLDPAVSYQLSLYASRNATDNRETQYTVTGVTESIVFLNVAGNIDGRVVVEAIKPASDGTITLGLEPGPNNDNGNHFTYLGVMQLDWEEDRSVPEVVTIADITMNGSQLELTVSGRAGQTYDVESTTDFGTWRTVTQISLSGESATVTVDRNQESEFFRVRR